MTELSGMSKSVLAVVMTVIIITIGAIVLDEFQTTMVDLEGGDCIKGACNTSSAYNVTLEGLGGMNTFADWIDIIVIMVVVGIVIGLIYGVFRYVGGGNTGY